MSLARETSAHVARFRGGARVADVEEVPIASAGEPDAAKARKAMTQVGLVARLPSRGAQLPLTKEVEEKAWEPRH
ncbi:hypothetical protein NDU88_005338 [Pleurodeles waltl]|uniref:Uncharacterized protein n=1 Tax=Pleurodeles waltl TaxID=8319 RepID=A0AAV7PI95_PLEWA|nr:hypothetical protein NDU88_005338 [Pleurodeles waltl]